MYVTGRHSFLNGNDRLPQLYGRRASINFDSAAMLLRLLHTFRPKLQDKSRISKPKIIGSLITKGTREALWLMLKDSSFAAQSARSIIEASLEIIGQYLWKASRTIRTVLIESTLS